MESVSFDIINMSGVATVYGGSPNAPLPFFKSGSLVINVQDFIHRGLRGST